MILYFEGKGLEDFEISDDFLIDFFSKWILFEFDVVERVSEFKLSFSIREFESDIFEMWKDAQQKKLFETFFFK